MGLSENRGYPQIAILMGNMVIIHWNMRYTIFRQTQIMIYNHNGNSDVSRPSYWGCPESLPRNSLLVQVLQGQRYTSCVAPGHTAEISRKSIKHDQNGWCNGCSSTSVYLFYKCSINLPSHFLS